MLPYVFRRLVLMVPALLLLTVVVFVLIRVAPGNAAQLQLAESGAGSQQAIKELEHQWHLDRPIPVQYGLWLRDIAGGRFGRSLWTGSNTLGQVGRYLPVTVELAVLSVLLATLVGVPVGVAAAYRRGGLTDHGLRFASVVGLAVPGFWLGTMLIVLPSVWWGYAPPLVYTPLWKDVVENVKQMVLPSAVIAVYLAATTIRVTRSVVLDFLRSDFVRTARAKGLAGRTIAGRHVMRNAGVPVLTLIGAQFGILLGGVVVQEQVFALPGLGRLTLESIVHRDYTQVQLNVLVFALMVMLVNLLTDVAYAVFDPRIRYS